jgi:hypothetical protein
MHVQVKYKKLFSASGWQAPAQAGAMNSHCPPEPIYTTNFSDSLESFSGKFLQLTHMCREPQLKGRITGIINSNVCQGHRRPERFEKMEFFKKN